MMEMLMLLGAGLVAAGVVGMSGILPQYSPAEGAAGTVDPGDAGMAEGESKDLLGRIREMGILPDFGKGKSRLIAAETWSDAHGAPVDDPADDPADEPADGPEEGPVAGASEAAEEEDDDFDISQFLEEAGMQDEEDALALTEDRLEQDVEVDSADAAEPILFEAEAPHAETPQAPSDNEIDAMLARLGNMQQPQAPVETQVAATEPAIDPAPEAESLEHPLEAESFDGDDIPVISDFIAGEDSLMLMLPEDMDADTIIRIERAGDTGSDAAIVLEDTRGSVTAAVISGGFGAVTPEDIELERAA